MGKIPPEPQGSAQTTDHPEERAKLATPARSRGRASEIASGDAVSGLHASRYVTGTELVIDVRHERGQRIRRT